MEEFIEQEIEDLRSKMVEAGKKFGLKHPIVLKYSMEIDSLHNVLLYIDRTRKRNTVKSYLFVKKYKPRAIRFSGQAL
ncbi:MAG: aspartyl-phosphate phosphatase Spo0E family protein [Bacillaceae bacterium]|nr:aspartyl-phosphate phosphatase Spo0E family protein [Bacillaceae bacterium]